MAESWNLAIPVEKLCFIIGMARRFDAKEEATDPDSGSNPTDDGMRDVLEDTPDDAIQAELVSFIDDLNDDEQADLVALAWFGRGDGDLEGPDGLRAEAVRAHNKRTATYLLGIPLLADYLEDALSQLGESCEGSESA